MAGFVTLALVTGFLSGVRWPETYTLTHLVMDYHFGFGKRGMIGAILRLTLHRPYHYRTLAALSFGVFGACVVVTGVLSRRSVLRDADVGAALLLLLLSAGFASLVNDAGRGEDFGWLLAVVCLLLPAGVVWLALRALLLVAAVLMHEANFLIFAPLVAFDVWLGWRDRSIWRAALLAGSVALPVAVLTLYLGNLRTACDTPGAERFFQTLAADFEIRWPPVATLCNDGHENLRIVATYLWGDASKAALLPLVLLVVLPATIFNLWLLAARVRGWIDLAAGVVATFSPMLLLVVAVDVTRFVSMIVLTSFLALISVTRRLKADWPARRVGPAVVIALVIFEAGSSIRLNDGTSMLRFPFEPIVERMIAVAQGKQPFVIIDGAPVGRER